MSRIATLRWYICAGFYPMTFFFRNEKIVQVNSGPDDFGVGAQYARSQCEQLGAPFKQKP